MEQIDLELISRDDIQKLVLMRLKAGEATREELDRLIDWAENVAIEHFILEGILKEKLIIRWPEGQEEYEVMVASAFE